MNKRTKRLLVMAIVALPWSASGQPRGASLIEAAPAGQPYDYIIHVENTYDYRYNPQVRDDRILLAKQIVKPFCSKSRIVHEAEFNTEIFGLVTGRLEYIVYVKCLSKVGDRWRIQRLGFSAGSASVAATTR